MKIFYPKSFLLIVFCLTGIFANAQRSNGLAVEGKITVEEGAVEGAVIEMYRDGTRLDNYGVGASGDYKLELNYGNKFELIFKADNNFPQKIVVDTNVPKSVLNSNPKFPPFPVNVNLFTRIDGIDNTFSQNTVMKIYYSADVDNFISDLYYNNAQIKKLIDQAILQAQVIGKEADYLSKLTKAELAELRKEYNEMLQQAGKQYSDEQFLAALDGYKAASKIFPNEQFPKDRIAEINDLLGLIMAAEDLDNALAERFTTLIKEADLLFDAKKYAEAKNDYNRALSINPTDVHATDRINQINTILKQKQTDVSYTEAITKADNAFKELLFKDATALYQQALEIKPNEDYPKQKINEIKNKLAEQKKTLEKQSNYKQAIFQAEVLFEKQFYEKSLASYQNALTYKPGDELATQKINEISELMQRLSNKTLYDKHIKTADKAFNKKEYQLALNEYKEAQLLFADEKYPSEKIAEITTIIANEKAFAEFKNKGNVLFETKKFNEAKTAYLKALEIHSNDKEAKKRVAEIERIIAQQGIDEQYNNLIAEADSQLDKKLYEEAKEKYNEALVLKSNEKYPKDKISEIEGILNKIAAANESYRKSIENADRLFNNKDYRKSRVAFEQAFKIKPAEMYPAEMISKIDNILAEEARLLAEQKAAEQKRLADEAAAEQARLKAQQKLIDNRYQQIIDEANQLVADNKLAPAVGKLREALDVKPQEKYPITRIEEIRGMIAREQEIQKTYDKAITLGETQLKVGHFVEARLAFSDAGVAKPDEKYPAIKIAEIDSIVASREKLAAAQKAAEEARQAALQAEIDNKYKNAIDRAQKSFDNAEFETARTEFRMALKIKPNDSLAQNKIDEISSLLARLSETQMAYEEAIKSGDKEFRRENFESAKNAYARAQQIKSNEIYPGKQIATIDSIVNTRAQLAAQAAAAEAARLAAIQAEKDKKYNKAIAEATDFLNNKNYTEARSEYKNALKIKPDEELPKNKIEEIDNLLAALELQQKEKELLETNYARFIQQADKLMAANSLEEAKTTYAKALELKPNEKYPQTKMNDVDKLLQQLAIDKQYREVVLAADALYKSEEYAEAKTKYINALEIKPDEQHPKNQITKIDDYFKQEEKQQLALKQSEEDLERRKRDAEIMNKRIKELQILNDSELDIYYLEYIQKGDSTFAQKLYNVSRAWYYKALDVKPEENYAQEKINEINKIINSQLLSQRQRDFQKFVNLADSMMRENQLAVARGWYNRALGINPGDTYAKDQIKEIQNTIAERQAGQSEQLFNSHVEKAKNAFDSKDYNVARYWYKKALSLRPNNEEAKARLTEIQKLISK